MVIAPWDNLSQKNGGLSLVDDPEQLPAHAQFAYLYLPMIVAVIYGLILNWIDLDVKRIYPWLQMSKPTGAKAKDSLFLHYELNFALWLPIKAIRRGHWTIALSGFITLLATFVVTPLHSSFLGVDILLTRREVQMSTPSELIDPVAQAAVFDVTLLNAAYAITWLDQPFPAFTTPEYMLLPFYPSESAQDNVANWTGVTTKYWTEIRCWPAKVTHDNDTLHYDEGYHFDNGQNCSTTEVYIESRPGAENLFYTGWYADDEVDLNLECATCGPAAKNQFLAIWYHAGDTRVNSYTDTTKVEIMTSEFCEPSYYKQKVKATISADGLVPIDGHVEPLGPVETLPPTEFNSSAFEFLLGVGVSQNKMARDYPLNYLLDQTSRIGKWKFLRPLWSPLVGFALGRTNASSHEFSDPEFMRLAFQGVHQMLFSAALPRLLKNSTLPNNGPGEVFSIKFGVVVSRLFSALIELSLGIVTLLVMVLFWVCHRSPSMLSEDPVTLGHLLSVVQNSPLLLKVFRGKGGLTLPSSNFNVNKILIGYLPTIFSSVLVEPFWLALSRMLCLLQPFYDLLSNRGTAQRTINAPYAAIPAQFATFQALEARHFLLGMVCFGAALGSVLSVGLGALFDQRPMPVIYPLNMSRRAQLSSPEPIVSVTPAGGAWSDHFQVAMANLSFGTPLPPWTTRDLSFLPVSLSSPSQSFEKGVIYSARAVGFGVEPSCKSLGAFLTQNVPPMIDPSLADPNGNFTDCYRDYRFPAMWLKNVRGRRMEGKYTSEIVSSFAPYSFYPVCPQWLIVGWARSDLSSILINQTSSTYDYFGVVNSSFVACTPVATVADYDIRFDYQGRIVSTSAVQNATAHSQSQHAKMAASLQGLVHNQTASWEFNQNFWHNDSVSQDPFSTLLRLESGSDALFDPSAQTPDPERMIPSITSVYKLMNALTINTALMAMENATQEAIVGSRSTVEVRVFVSSPAFYASLFVLLLYLPVTVAFYIWGVKFAFPRLPHSVGSQLAYIASSSLANGASDARELFESMEGMTFRFGTLTGPDGKEDIGVDSSDRVTPIEPASVVQHLKRRKVWSKLRWKSKKTEQKEEKVLENFI
ncbi:hypothetical protein ESCO_000606 [Escovopsis weberi]|uniref:Uncharacterized protein n=1 Tax=Escovopsis weberi TaxID=150374 RepID=A0A0M8N499_ESCWE|nr:hypothetical protein ESCO_000606 [Escovopsis weberi]